MKTRFELNRLHKGTVNHHEIYSKEYHQTLKTELKRVQKIGKENRSTHFIFAKDYELNDGKIFLFVPGILNSTVKDFYKTKVKQAGKYKHGQGQIIIVLDPNTQKRKCYIWIDPKSKLAPNAFKKEFVKLLKSIGLANLEVNVTSSLEFFEQAKNRNGHKIDVKGLLVQYQTMHNFYFREIEQFLQNKNQRRNIDKALALKLLKNIEKFKADSSIWIAGTHTIKTDDRIKDKVTWANKKHIYLDQKILPWLNTVAKGSASTQQTDSELSQQVQQIDQDFKAFKQALQQLKTAKTVNAATINKLNQLADKLDRPMRNWFEKHANLKDVNARKLHQANRQKLLAYQKELQAQQPLIEGLQGQNKAVVLQIMKLQKAIKDNKSNYYSLYKKIVESQDLTQWRKTGYDAQTAATIKKQFEDLVKQVNQAIQLLTNNSAVQGVFQKSFPLATLNKLKAELDRHKSFVDYMHQQLSNPNTANNRDQGLKLFNEAIAAYNQVLQFNRLLEKGASNKLDSVLSSLQAAINNFSSKENAFQTQRDLSKTATITEQQIQQLAAYKTAVNKILQTVNFLKGADAKKLLKDFLAVQDYLKQLKTYQTAIQNNTFTNESKNEISTLAVNIREKATAWLSFYQTKATEQTIQNYFASKQQQVSKWQKQGLQILQLLKKQASR